MVCCKIAAVARQAVAPDVEEMPRIYELHKYRLQTPGPENGLQADFMQGLLPETTRSKTKRRISQERSRAPQCPQEPNAIPVCSEE